MESIEPTLCDILELFKNVILNIICPTSNAIFRNYNARSMLHISIFCGSMPLKKTLTITCRMPNFQLIDFYFVVNDGAFKL